MPDRLNTIRHDVFISYKSEDSSWARRLAETLKWFNLRFYRDHEDDGLQPSEPWSPSLNTAVGESRVMVVLWSQAAATDSKTKGLRLLLKRLRRFGDGL